MCNCERVYRGMRFALQAMLITGIALSPSLANGQDYPTKPVQLMTSEVGGGGDFGARILSQELALALGQQFIVQNRPLNAPELVAKATPDGYTLMFFGSTVWISPLVRPASWIPLRDFAPVSLAIRAPNIVTVNAYLPAQSLRALLVLARARPGELNYASSSIGTSTHLAAALFNSMAKVDIVQINYKGIAPAVVDLVAGRVQVMFAAPGSVVAHIKSGKLRALAVTSATPSALFPDLPTVSASGVPGYESSAQFGMFAPSKTPEILIARLNREIARILSKADVKERFLSVGSETVGGSADDFRKTIQSDVQRLGKVIRDAGIRVE